MKDISKAYNPAQVEDKWYEEWIQAGCFKGKVDESKPSYAISIPPPNVTGVLTMGHVLNNTIQDILIRRARQEGKSAVWIPGTDHAGVATQSKVEAQLRKEGTNSKELGRDKFIEVAKEWRDKHGGIIIEQLKKLGASCDWDRLVHTLDEDYSKAVLTAFVALFKRGYIYRGKRMVNWCPVNLTALSDEEVIMTPQKSKLYKMRYELEDGGYLEISTTRPETIMGDTAVAVNPKDGRYQHLIGKYCYRPFPRQKIIIVGDEAVDKEFGTGVLKVTPAHDIVDFEIGQRNNLEVIDVINPDGTMNELAGSEFEGLDRFKARSLAAKKLEELGLLVKIEDYDNSIGYSERGNVPIEPRLSDQWFMKYPKIAEAKTAVEESSIKFWPKRWEKTYTHWLDNIKDWCISRQIWWGHRIPVWYRKGVINPDINNEQEVHVSVEGPSDKENWVQDEDSLDTWASSWLWPFAILGWPDKDKMKELGFDYFYPTTDLVTGPDIIFFWVARMIMAGLEFLPEESLKDDKIPFKNVYFTGIIRDMQGRKMSKSLGNSPDPLDLIAKFGADGLRFGVMNCAPQGADILFSQDRVELGRNFCNKLWNACRFRQMSGEVYDNSSIEAITSRIDKSLMDDDDSAILQNLIKCSDLVEGDYKNYQFNSVTHNLYTFFWTDFCDWYLEVSKARLGDARVKETVLAIQDLCIRQILIFLHPFMPFITEELWHNMGYGKEGEYLQNESPYFKESLASLGLDEGAYNEILKLKDVVQKARALKAQCKMGNKKDVEFDILLSISEDKFESNKDKMKRLIGAKDIYLAKEAIDSPVSLTEYGSLYIRSNISQEEDKLKMAKELSKLEAVVASSKARLANEAFVSKAPANVIEGAKKQLEDNLSKIEELKKLLSK